MNWLARSRTSALGVPASWSAVLEQQQVPRCLGDPDAAGVVSDPCEVHGSGPDVDAQQQVERAQRDGFDGGEVACDSALGPQELRPSDFGACGCRVDSGVVEDLPDRGRSEAVAEPGEFALDAAVSPSRILSCEAQRESAKLLPKSTVGPAVAVVASSARRCGAGANPTACRR